MTEPDEALLLAKAPTNEQIIALAVYRWRRAGGPPADYSHFVIEVMRECWTEAYRAGAAASDARIKALEAALEKVFDLLSDAMQADCENGVRSLNEAAAANYLNDFPHTKKALTDIQAVCRSMLKETAR